MPITSRVIEELAYQGFSRRDHSHGSVLLGARSQTELEGGLVLVYNFKLVK